MRFDPNLTKSAQVEGIRTVRLHLAVAAVSFPATLASLRLAARTVLSVMSSTPARLKHVVARPLSALRRSNLGSGSASTTGITWSEPPSALRDIGPGALHPARFFVRHSRTDDLSAFARHPRVGRRAADSNVSSSCVLMRSNEHAILEMMLAGTRRRRIGPSARPSAGSGSRSCARGGTGGSRYRTASARRRRSARA